MANYGHELFMHLQFIKGELNLTHQLLGINLWLKQKMWRLISSATIADQRTTMIDMNISLFSNKIKNFLLYSKNSASLSLNW